MAGIQQTVKIVKAFKHVAPKVKGQAVLEHALGDIKIIRNGSHTPALFKNGKFVRALTEDELTLACTSKISTLDSGNGIRTVIDEFTGQKYRVNMNNKAVDTLCHTVSGDPTKDLNFYMPMKEGTKKNAILELLGYFKGLNVFIN